MTDMQPSVTVEQVRSSFPALQRLQGNIPVAYFDGPGGTQVPLHVSDAVTEYLLTHNSNWHWNYPTSLETDKVVTYAREAVAEMLGAGTSEIAFGPNMTTLTFHLSRALGREYGPGDEIVVTELDHHANIAPWQALEKERGITLKWVRFDTDSGLLDWDDLTEQLTSNTRLLAISAASNALGTIIEIGRAIEMAHAVGAEVFVDAVHLLPHQLVDVRALDCEFLAGSVYKFYGPHVGFLYTRQDRLESLDVAKLIPSPDIVPDRFETGTLNLEGIAGTGAIVEYLASLGTGSTRRECLASAFDTFHGWGTELIGRLWAGLASQDRVTLYGPAPGTPRTPTLSFTVEGMLSGDVTTALAKEGLYLTNGNFYARTIAERYGQLEHGFIRAGCACYTTMDEIERLIEAVASL